MMLSTISSHFRTASYDESISYTYFPNLELYAPDLEGQILKAGIEFLVELR